MTAGFRPTADHRVGISLKPEHYRDILDTDPNIGWFEVHPENYMVLGGPPLRWLKVIRERWPLSLHGVGMSLGSSERPPDDHLQALKRLIDRFDPFLVSEHLSWSRTGKIFLTDLLPLPMTKEALDAVAGNVSHAQDVLGRQILIENPSVYLALAGDGIPETEFLRELSMRTGCGLLLDINNVYVAARNLDFDARDYLGAYPMAAVGEIHLSGHATERRDNLEICIDDHGSPVPDGVWALYEEVVPQCPEAPVLIERDDNIPALAELLAEATRAETALAGIPAGNCATQRHPIRQQNNNLQAAPASTGFGLADFQETFRHAMGVGHDTSGAGYTGEQTTPAAREYADAALLPALAHTGGMSQHVRLDVYRNNIASALVWSLRGLYPSLLSLAGEEFFDAMARDYACQNPPAHGVLCEYGHDFPEFVGRFASAADWPYFADAAHLDLAWFCAYAAPEAAPCNPARLASITPEDLPAIQLALHPSHTLLRSPWPLDRIREVALGDADSQDAVDIGENPALLLVIRPQAEVEIRTLDEGGFAFLQALESGGTLAEAAAEATAQDSVFDAARHLADHLEGGTFSSCTLRGKAV